MPEFFLLGASWFRAPPTSPTSSLEHDPEKWKSGKVITGFRIDESRVESDSGHLCRCALNTFRDAGPIGTLVHRSDTVARSVQG